MFDHLLESSQWDDSNKWSNIGFDEEIEILEIKIRTLSGALAVVPILSASWPSHGHSIKYIWHAPKTTIIAMLHKN